MNTENLIEELRFVSEERDEARAELEAARADASALATKIHNEEYTERIKGAWGVANTVPGVIKQIGKMFADVQRLRNEAQAEAKQLNEALYDCRAEVERLKGQIHGHLDGLKVPEGDIAERIAALAKERDAAKEEASRLRCQLNSIQNVISDAGFSEVIEPLERVTRLIRERDNAIYLADKAENKVARLKRDQTKSATINQQLTVRPEPSRLEIAAMLLQGWASNPSIQALATYQNERPPAAALRIADALIAAAREVAE